ncbi:PREDICTED: uncharacterized protein LOC108966385 [Bactrocera latifrons]|uniref:uncharacterized protein LOC108966385 n=1 Tax=Bactrocera latifrons TaxID=174628 RepID=UPI0008DE149D|nr:PREDICTED: uncharacterized protein LOC108966385 [Bactrocera latifrons]
MMQKRILSLLIAVVVIQLVAAQYYNYGFRNEPPPPLPMTERPTTYSQEGLPPPRKPYPYYNDELPAEEVFD